MDPQLRFRINSPEVVSESFGGEVVAIHFGSGNYYSLTGAAAEILALLDAGSSVSEVTKHLAFRYDGLSSEDMASAVREFVASLLHEELITERNPREADAFPPSETQQGPFLAQKTPFEPPRLEKYGDMQDLLLLDPIHDVDEVGWPKALPDTPSKG